MTDIHALIEKLEAAEEGSRELDCEIVCFLEGFDFDEECPKHKDGRRRIDLRHVPRYSESIDAAITLVAPDIWWVLNSGRETGDATAVLKGNVEARAATPALALCIAALKARHE